MIFLKNSFSLIFFNFFFSEVKRPFSFSETENYNFLKIILFFDLKSINFHV